jgi:hypothetical protein
MNLPIKFSRLLTISKKFINPKERGTHHHPRITKKSPMHKKNPRIPPVHPIISHPSPTQKNT